MRTAAIVLLLALCASACATASGQDVTAAPNAGSAGPLAGQAALEVFPAGFAASGTALRNGAGVPLAGDVKVEVFVDPYPATGSTVWLDLYVLKAGTAVDKADVTSDSAMAYMSHGTTHEDGNNSGDGHYLFALNNPMVGPWQHLIHIQIEDQRYDLPLVVTVYPS